MLLEKVLKNPEQKEYLISSEMSGVLMAADTLLANAKVTRALRWNGNDEETIDFFQTNSKGEFTIPAHSERLSLGALEQFVSHAHFSVEIAGVSKLFWVESKLSNELEDPSSTEYKNLTCNAAIEIEWVTKEYGVLNTSCTWENMPKEEDPYAP